MGQADDNYRDHNSESQHTEVLPTSKTQAGSHLGGAPVAGVHGETPEPGNRDGESLGAAGGDGANSAHVDQAPKSADESTLLNMRTVAMGVGAGVLVAMIAYGGLAFAAAGRMPPRATIGGVDVAGQNSEQAVGTLSQAVDAKMAEPLTLKAGEATTQVDARAAGLTIDPQQSVEHVTSFSLNPGTIISKFFGSAEYDFVTSYDEGALTSAMNEAIADLDRDPVEAAIEFSGTSPQITEPHRGVSVKREQATPAVVEQWPGSWTVELPFEATEPEAGQDDLDAVMAEFVEPAFDGPLTFTVSAEDTSGKAGLSASLSPEQFAPAVSVVAEDGRLVGAVDGEKLRDTIVEVNPEIGVKPKDAHFEIVGGKPKVIPAVTGISVDPADASSGFLTAITAPDRKASVKTATQEAEFTTADAEKLGVVELISKFDSAMPHNPVRTHNIETAANKINGTLLLPGEKFSMNEILGKRTKESGYKPAPVIMGGKLVDDYGGGISQLATTLFNGMFFAGLDELAHRPHSFYISRYPEGRESTINYGTIDLAFKNDSQHGVFIETWVSGGAVHTRFWGTKRYEVEAVKGPRRSIVPAPVKIVEDADCKPKSGQIGFKVSVTRILRQNGQEVGRETFNHTYNPREKVVCKKPEPVRPEPAEVESETAGEQAPEPETEAVPADAPA